MEKRIKIQEVEPKAYQAMFTLEKYLNSSMVEKIIRDLIKIRASQINGCAYCIELHAGEAIKNGEDKRRIFGLSAWKESSLFSEKEKTVLQMTEEITRISKKGLSSKSYTLAQKHFTANEIAQIIMQVGTINMWNRIAVSTRLVPGE